MLPADIFTQSAMCFAFPPRHRKKAKQKIPSEKLGTFLLFESGAGERVRTANIHLGKVVLYQLSYARLDCRSNKSKSKEIFFI